VDARPAGGRAGVERVLSRAALAGTARPRAPALAERRRRPRSRRPRRSPRAGGERLPGGVPERAEVRRFSPRLQHLSVPARRDPDRADDRLPFAGRRGRLRGAARARGSRGMRATFALGSRQGTGLPRGTPPSCPRRGRATGRATAISTCSRSSRTSSSCSRRARSERSPRKRTSTSLLPCPATRVARSTSPSPCTQPTSMRTDERTVSSSREISAPTRCERRSSSIRRRRNVDSTRAACPRSYW
jgi:hypothetical protein